MIKKYKKKLILVKIIYIFIVTDLYASDIYQDLMNLLETNYPAEINFRQSSGDSFQDGWMIIAGKGKARTEFTPPNNILIIADGKWIIFHDPEIDRTTYLPLNKGILQALLDPKAFKKKKELNVTKIVEDNIITFTINFNVNNQNQKVFIHFEKISSNLLGWKIIESAEDEILVEVTKIKKIKNKNVLNDNMFKFTDYNLNNSPIYLGPYSERKIKKVKNNGRLNQ